MIETTRKIVRFCLAGFLWLHAFFVLDISTNPIKRLSSWFHVTTVETTLFALLLIFSFVASTGFWRGVGNLAYIYFFPFVVFFYSCVGLFYGLRALARLPQRKITPTSEAAPEIEVKTIIQSSASDSSPPQPISDRVRKCASILLRPFKRFTILWCFLLLFTTHQPILWASLLLVSFHLVRIVIATLRVNLSSGTWLEIVEKVLHKSTDDWIAKLRNVTHDTPPSPELKNVLLGLQFWEKTIDFLQDERLLSRWALLLCAVAFGSIYV